MARTHRRIAVHYASTLAIAVVLIVSVVSTMWAADPGPADKDAPAEFSNTDSGLKYRILRKSDGKKPAATDTVTVHYRGWLDGGKEFDSSYKRDEPATFPLNRVIKGWTEGMQLVGKGGMIELEIPAKLGYGERGAGDAVPPNATLHFLVELIEIK
jgi:FKBP-type peptidyl-prolyl cis-trans isomerase FkpA